MIGSLHDLDCAGPQDCSCKAVYIVTLPRVDYTERFWSKVDKSGDCWLWTAAIGGNGYGAFAVTKRNIRPAHRVAYELVVGPIPEGLELDHLCRNSSCVRPSHLEAVTHRENLLRGNSPSGRRARQIVCMRGHQLTVRQNGYRRCITCDNDRRRQARRST